MSTTLSPQFESFSPLAGISYVETQLLTSADYQQDQVSVPLRGLVMWKQRWRLAGMVERLFQSPCGD